MRVVVADDYAIFRKVIADVVRREGHTVIEVGDGDALLRALLDDRPDLVVSDVRLPVLDAFDALEKARAAGLTAPAIFMTGLSLDDRVASRAARLGVVCILQKPFEAEDLRTILAGLG